jgi:hypothetical protein
MALKIVVDNHVMGLYQQPLFLYHIPMSEMFTMDRRSFKELEKWFKVLGPKQFMYAAKGVLNEFAFGVKKEIPREVGRNMIVRNTGFVSSSVRVNKAKGSTLQNVYSQTYVVRRDRFSGWQEQEFGKPTLLKRTITKAARGGNWQNKVKAQARLKSTNEFFDPRAVKGNSYTHSVAGMLAGMRRGKSLKRKPFKITKQMTGKLNSLKKGVYLWKGKLIERVQTFGKKTQPKKIPIVKKARLRYFASVSINGIWAENIKRQLMFKK